MSSEVPDSSQVGEADGSILPADVLTLTERYVSNCYIVSL